MAWPELTLTEPTDKTATGSTGRRPRWCRSTTRKVIYHGANVLFRTTDRGKTLGAHLARPHAQRQGDAGLGRHAHHERRRGWRGVRHHRRDRRVAARCRTHLRGHGRRARAAHARRRQIVDERDARRRSPSASRTRSRSRRTMPARCTSRSAWTVAATTRRYAFRSTDYGEDVDAHREWLARGRAGARGARGPRASWTAVRGHGDRRVRVVRRRRQLADAVAQPAGRSRSPISRCVTATCIAATEGRVVLGAR